MAARHRREHARHRSRWRPGHGCAARIPRSRSGASVGGAFRSCHWRRDDAGGARGHGQTAVELRGEPRADRPLGEIRVPRRRLLAVLDADDFFDAFLSVLNADGTALVYSTYLAGNGIEYGDGVAVDRDGHALVTGKTFSTNFPTRNAFQPSYAGNGQDFTNGASGDAFIVKIDPFEARDASLIYASYLGGDRVDAGFAVAVDDAGNAYVTGRTNTRDNQTVPFPTTPGALRRVPDSTFGPYYFVTKVDPTGALVYSTLLGQTAGDFAVTNGVTFLHSVRGGIAVDPAGNAWITGAGAQGFPQVQPLQPTFGGSLYDVFVAQLDATGSMLLFFNASGGCRVASGTVTCTVPGTMAPGATAEVSIAARPTASGQLRNTASVTAAQADPNPANNAATAVTENAAVFADLGVTMTASSMPGRHRTLYTITVKNHGPRAAPGVVVYEAGFAPGNQFVSATTSRGKCTGAVMATCNIGSLAKGATAVVKITRAPTIAGEISHVVAVRGAVHDQNQANDSALVVTVAP